MRTLYSIVWLLAIAALLLSACSLSTKPSKPMPAKFEIVETENRMKSYGCPYIRITVENVGQTVGYNAACYAHAKDGAGVIIDTGFAYFADGGNISPRERARADAIFFELSSHTDYSSVKYELSWLVRD